MAKHFTVTALEFTVSDIAYSSARSRYFEFLMLKRTFVISGESQVTFAEGDSAYKQAINELGSVYQTSPNVQYINIFSTNDNSNGYRSGRYISNGPNTTVGGTAWQRVISIDNSVRPRKLSLAIGYENSLHSFLLKRPSRKPDIYSFAIWVNRFSDLSTIIEDFDDTDNTEVLLRFLVSDTIEKYGLTPDEINILFDKSPVRNINDHSLSSLIQDEIANPSQYLPPVVQIESVGTGIEVSIDQFLGEQPLQKIYFGAPGSGKSRRASLHTVGMTVFRTTFHPDTDYASFVGTYKPAMKPDGMITYAFVAQIFTKAYIAAWQDLSKPVCLLVEEINRGNCAQIFGDLFQLLDRDNDTGFSKYPLHADTDLATYLAENLTDEGAYTHYVGGVDQLMLPPNLLLYATMNTSDQSLFPMDSAFKRRWDWEYVPIDYADAASIRIQIGDLFFNWGTFIEVVNPLIYDLKGSEDKQLGNRFVDPANGLLLADQFRSKVLFYLWNEVWRDEHESGNTIFQEKGETGEIKPIKTFGELFRGTPDEQTALLQRFMAANGIDPE